MAGDAALDDTATSPPGTPPPLTPSPAAAAAPPGTVEMPRFAGDPTRGDETRDERRAGQPLPAPAGPARDLPFVDPSNYEIAGEHARGGLGRVLRARDRRLERTVALKELAHGPSARTAQRFVREALITARLQHPSIVPIYEAGRWPSGDPFYAMKLVSGASLDEAIEKRSALDARLALLPHVLAVAEAVAYAHTEGVIHRDLKPANVMLGAFGETQVVDWGLAKDRRLADDPTAAAEDDSLYAHAHAEMTRVGSVVGTPAYMPPEQARGEEVDERADVYAIGAMLYHLLAAEPPFEGAPDTVVARVAKGPPVPLVERAPEAPHDLVAIVDKAMARDPSLRYPTARELAQDLSRFLTGQLVGARAYGRMTLVARWLRRNRTPVAVAAVLLTALAATAAFSAVRIVRERNVARARSAELVLTQARSMLERDPTATLAWLKQYPDDGADWAEVQRVAADAESRGVATRILAGHSAPVTAIALSPDGARVATASGDIVQLFDARTGASQARFALETVQLAFSPDGEWLALGGSDGEIRIVPATTMDGDDARQLGKQAGWTGGLAFSPDGTLLASAGGDGLIDLWHPWSGAHRELRGHAGQVAWIKFVDQGRALLSGGRDGQVLRWDLASGTSERLFRVELTRGVPFDASADGRLVAYAQNERVLVWRDGELVPTEVARHAGPVTALLVTADGRVLSGSEDSTVDEWSPAHPARVWNEHHHAVTALMTSVDGSTVASGDADGAIVVHEHGGARVLLGHRRGITQLAFAPDGHTLYSGGGDGQVREWPLEQDVRRVPAATQDVFRVAFVEHGTRIATTSRDHVVRTIDPRNGDVHALGERASAVFDLEEMPASSRLVTGGWDGELAIWANDAPPVLIERPGAQIWSVAVSPDERQLATAASDGQVWLWSTATGTGELLHRHGTDAADVIFSPDGRLVASSGDDRVVRVRDLATGTDRDLPGSSDVAQVLLFSHDGRSLFAAELDGSVVAWDVPAGTLRILGHHTARARALVLSPDGRWLASGSADRTIAVYDLRTGTRRELIGHEGEVRHLAFSPDGRWLASAGWDGSVRLWGLSDGGLRVYRKQLGRVHRVAFSPDTHWLASGADDGSVAIDDLTDVTPAPAAGAALRAWLERSTAATVDVSGALGEATRERSGSRRDSSRRR